MKRERIEREKKIEDGLLPKKSTWQAQSCVEGVASREVSRQAQSAIPRHRSCCCWWRQRATRQGTTKTCREQETPVAANAARASSLTSPEPCSSYLASRAEASARGPPLEGNNSGWAGRHKRPARGNRQGFQTGPPLRARLVDMATTKSHFVRGKLLFALFWEPLSPLLVHFMFIRTPLFFLFGFFFLFGVAFLPKTPFPSVYL